MEKNDKVRNHHLVTSNKIIDLGTDHKEMLRKKETNTNYPYQEWKVECHYRPYRL